jgi:fructosamine-3-kinase
LREFAEAGARLLGGALHRAEALHGGDLSSVAHIDLQDGRQAVIKTGPAPRFEAAMLRAMAAAGAPVPPVLAVDDRVLAIGFVAAHGTLGDAWADLGRCLARLHSTTGKRYGWADDYAFGPVAIENGWAMCWPDFYAQRRLLPHLPHVSSAIARRVETLAEDLGNRLPRNPPAALLHGDLWGGNVLVAGSNIAAFIDPACIYGHAEVDVAMLGLFDRPNAEFREAYGAAEPGLEERLAIYRLWPALVHLRLFGSAYRGMVEGLLAEAGV